MAEVHPKVRRIRTIGVAVFLAMASLSVPLGMHIHRTWPSPELGLTLLGAVLLLVLIALFSLETVVTPIPEPQYTEEDALGADLDETVMHDPDVPIVAPTQIVEPPSDTPMAAPTEMLEPAPESMSNLATELDLSQQITANPDAPMLVVPNPALAHAETRLSDTEISADAGEEPST